MRRCITFERQDPARIQLEGSEKDRTVEAEAENLEDDDFEGNRNWAVILIIAAVTVLPLIGILMLVF